MLDFQHFTVCVCDCYAVFTMTAVSSEDVDKNLAIAESAHQLGYATLKEFQVKAISSIVEGQDTFVSLPTGYGKSIIYAALPLVFDKLKGMSVNYLY